ncbi:leucine-rich repeat domain-containing protein, partial [Sediminivirga luteola]
SQIRCHLSVRQSHSAFRSNWLTSVTISNSVTSIGDQAFAYNQLTSVTISDSETSIGRAAFYGNNLTSVTIPDSVTSIGIGAFAQNPMMSASVHVNTHLGTDAFPSSTVIEWRDSSPDQANIGETEETPTEETAREEPEERRP